MQMVTSCFILTPQQPDPVDIDSLHTKKRPAPPHGYRVFITIRLGTMDKQARKVRCLKMGDAWGSTDLMKLTDDGEYEGGNAVYFY